MSTAPYQVPAEYAVLLRSLCLLSVLLFFFAFILSALYIRHRRLRGLWLSILILILSYSVVQVLFSRFFGQIEAGRLVLLLRRIAAAPGILLLLTGAMAAAELLLFRDALAYEKNHITGMSVKEAIDSLPVGICCYTPRGRILVANQTMETLCRTVTGEALVNGAEFKDRLVSGPLLSGCRTLWMGERPLVVLPDDTVWSLAAEETPLEQITATTLLASDITETYRKTRELESAQERVVALNRRLAAINREIVDVTIQREILNAKVRIHDELGSELLTMKRIILQGGSDQELAGLVTRLRQSVSFIRAEPPSHTAKDEYDRMLEAAERLGVRVIVTGKLPRAKAQKHILATALHECLTNTLRHAHGDELRLAITESGSTVTAVITNNGEQPTEEIREKGGLRSLRVMTENGGGRMTVSIDPVFSIKLELPKEAPHGL